MEKKNGSRKPLGYIVPDFAAPKCRGARFDHICVQMQDCPSAVKNFADLLGVQEDQVCRMPGYLDLTGPTYCDMVPTRNGWVEFVRPAKEGSSPYEAHRKRGDGFHHLSITWPELEFYEKYGELAGKGVRMVDEVPRIDNYGIHYGYIHPKATHRVLVELCHRWQEAGQGGAWDCSDDAYWGARGELNVEGCQARIDHIGILVADIDKGVETFGKILHISPDQVTSLPNFEDGEDRAEVRLLPLAGDVRLVLIMPTRPDGAIAKALANRGEGLHHIGFSLPEGELRPKFEELKGKGYRLIDEQPRRNNYGMEYGFVHPNSVSRILVLFCRHGTTRKVK